MRDGIAMPVMIAVAIAVAAFVLPDPVLSPPFSPLVSAGVMGIMAFVGALAGMHFYGRPPFGNHD